jgi:DNA-binding Lrp family transcriptional regulator
MAVKLDLYDKKILYELDMGGRQSFSEIGKKVRLSKNAVEYRVKNLMKEGVIEYFYTVADAYKLGYSGYRVYLHLQGLTKNKEDELADYLVKHKSTWWVGKLDGAWDFGFAMWAKTPAEFYDMWTGFLDKFRPYIRDKLISTMIEYIHYPRDYLLEEKLAKRKGWTVGGKGKAKYDEMDMGILRTIAFSARMPTTEIAKIVKTTPAVVAYRIRKLTESGVIQGYRAEINLKALGYVYYKVDVDLNDRNIYPKLLRFAEAHPNIIYIDRTIGGKDFEADFVVRDVHHLREIFGEMNKIFVDKIRSYEWYVLLKQYKYGYVPM